MEGILGGKLGFRSTGFLLLFFSSFTLIVNWEFLDLFSNFKISLSYARPCVPLSLVRGCSSGRQGSDLDLDV